MHQACRFRRSYERGVVSRVDVLINNVLGRIHFLATNYGILGTGIAELAARARMSSNKTAIFFFMMISPRI
jgi:hypothetical protein